MALFQPLGSSVQTADDTDTRAQLDRELRLQEIAAHYAQRAHEGPNSLGRYSSTCTQVVWIFFWFAVLLALAYPLALVSAIIYAILSPLILIDCCKPTIEALRNLLDLPLRCVRNMVEAKQLFVM